MVGVKHKGFVKKFNERLELDEVDWFALGKPRAEMREKLHFVTTVSREPRQMVGIDVAGEINRHKECRQWWMVAPLG